MNISVFCGSKDIPDREKWETVRSQFQWLLENNRSEIECINYGWGNWVMGMVREVSEEVGIALVWHTTELYRDEISRDDWRHYIYHPNDEVRIPKFEECSDAFIALPGSFWTIAEILRVANIIKDEGSNKYIYVSTLFDAFYKGFEIIDRQNMIWEHDKRVIKMVDDLWILKLQ